MQRVQRACNRLAQVGDQVLVERLLPEDLLRHLGFGSGISGENLRRRASWNRQRTIVTRSYKNSLGGSIIVRRDFCEQQIDAFLGETHVVHCAIRDRQFDGLGKLGRLSPLNKFTVNHELANALPHKNFKSAELSVYSWDPAHPLPRLELAKFIANPDSHIYPWRSFNHESFFPLWQEAFESGLAPWQQRPPVKGFAHHFVEAACDLLRQHGYHRAEAVPGWYNAALFFHKKEGFRFLDAGHETTFKLLEQRLAELAARRGTRLPVWQQAWIVALQNIPEAYLHMVPDLSLEGVHWINSPSGSDYCARLAMDLQEFEWPTPRERFTSKSVT
jgi:hypothetical protein